jgi:hypothetical protein
MSHKTNKNRNVILKDFVCPSNFCQPASLAVLLLPLRNNRLANVRARVCAATRAVFAVLPRPGDDISYFLHKPPISKKIL